MGVGASGETYTEILKGQCAQHKGEAIGRCSHTVSEAALDRAFYAMKKGGVFQEQKEFTDEI